VYRGTGVWLESLLSHNFVLDNFRSGDVAEGLTNAGDGASGEPASSNESPGKHPHQDHPGSPKIIQKEASPAPDSTSSEPAPPLSPDKSGKRR
jgi:hypothetical protein